MKKGTFIILAIVCFLSCSDSRYKSAENIADLSISFIDQNWDGKKVPTSGQCRSCGGKGLSPALMVTNIPENADALIVEFVDKTMNVFHGAIRVPVSDKAEIAIPSFQDQTYNLPDGVEAESEHTAPIGSSGPYLAPCGCGVRNKYVATIMAIKNETSGKNMLLGKGKITLGRY